MQTVKSENLPYDTVCGGESPMHEIRCPFGSFVERWYRGVTAETQQTTEKNPHKPSAKQTKPNRSENPRVGSSYFLCSHTQSPEGDDKARSDRYDRVP